MTCLRELVASAEPTTPRLDLGYQDIAETSPSERQAISGPAETADTKVNEDALVLSVKRLLLRQQIHTAKRQRKKASHYERELRAVTHELMGVS